MKKLIAAISLILWVLFPLNAQSATDQIPVLNKIFHINTAKKEKKVAQDKQISAIETNKPQDGPVLNEFFSINAGKNAKQALPAPEEALLKENEKLYVELGNAYTKSKMYKSAMEAYENALKIDPNNADAHFNLGLLYQDYLGDTEKAAYHLKKYIKVAPSPKKAEEAKYYLNILRQGRDWDLMKSTQ